jgi:hypothetical protein
MRLLVTLAIVAVLGTGGTALAQTPSGQVPGAAPPNGARNLGPESRRAVVGSHPRRMQHVWLLRRVPVLVKHRPEMGHPTYPQCIASVAGVRPCREACRASSRAR